ncbi:MAG: ornithine cyclodeaminase family protein [Acidobacteriota bacterium]
MKLLVLNQADVARLLPMNECIEVMASALEALSRGEAELPLRATMWLPDKTGALVTMPSYLGHINAFGLKVITYFAGNRGTPLDTHQGGVLLFDPKDGRLLAIVDATEITSLRTAAVTAVATRLLARPEASQLALLGAGTQARTHLDSMLMIRPIKRVKVWSLTVEESARFAAAASERHQVCVEVAATAEEAVRGVDLVCTVTSSIEPILKGAWIQPGTHINAIGSSIPFARELDSEAVRKSRLFVDRKESTVNEAGDFLLAKKEGVVDESHIVGEIGDILTGKLKGRNSPDEITLYKSLGLAIEDLASAQHVFRKAQEQGIGTVIEFGGSRHETS